MHEDTHRYSPGRSSWSVLAGPGTWPGPCPPAPGPCTRGSCASAQPGHSSPGRRTRPTRRSSRQTLQQETLSEALFQIISHTDTSHIVTGDNQLLAGSGCTWDKYLSRTGAGAGEQGAFITETTSSTEQSPAGVSEGQGNTPQHPASPSQADTAIIFLD